MASNYYLCIGRDSNSIHSDCSEYLFASQNFRGIIHVILDNSLGSDFMAAMEGMSLSCDMVVTINSDHYNCYLFHSHYIDGYWIFHLIFVNMCITDCIILLLLIIVIITSSISMHPIIIVIM